MIFYVSRQIIPVWVGLYDGILDTADGGSTLSQACVDKYAVEWRNQVAGRHDGLSKHYSYGLLPRCRCQCLQTTPKLDEARLNIGSIKLHYGSF